MRHCYVPSRCAVPCLYWHHLTGSTCVDLKASGEESKVPLWRDEHGSTSNTAPQAEEEGRQDGLRTPRQRRSSNSPARVPSFALSLPHLYRLFPSHSSPSISLCFCCSMLRLGVRRLSRR